MNNAQLTRARLASAPNFRRRLLLTWVASPARDDNGLGRVACLDHRVNQNLDVVRVIVSRSIATDRVPTSNPWVYIPTSKKRVSGHVRQMRIFGRNGETCEPRGHFRRVFGRQPNYGAMTKANCYRLKTCRDIRPADLRVELRLPDGNHRHARTGRTHFFRPSSTYWELSFQKQTRSRTRAQRHF
jgi:hypothetical protein